MSLEPVQRYSFTNAEQDLLFHKVIREIRCVVCENQSLYESRAPVALDLKNALYQEVLRGQTEVQLKHFVTERYGAFALYNPPFQIGTGLLWVGPILMLGWGLWMFKKYLR